MPKAILGRKLGMTQYFADDGSAATVTALEVGPCPVIQVKSRDKDGYSAVKIGFDPKREKSCTKPELGVFKKAGVAPCRFVREVRIDAESVKPGDTIQVSVFDGVQFVDVIGTTKGRGFAGVVKRHHFAGAPKSHGQTEGERVPGSLGRQGSVWGKVHPGKRMAGHMGHVRHTEKNLALVKVLAEKNVLLVRGAVPGPNGGYVIVRESPKRRTVHKAQAAGPQKKKIQIVKKGQ